jgi:transposase
MAVAITRTDLSARELRCSVEDERREAAQRMLALALVLEGVHRKTAAETCGMDRQTLRVWVRRYNADGLEGLPDRRSLGPSPSLSPDQKEL